jgi:hypothetical protein
VKLAADAILAVKKGAGAAMRETSRGLHAEVKRTLPFSPDDRIDHPTFGLGTIVEIDERRTTITFDESGTRKFVTSMVKLAPTDTPAPAKAAPRKKRARRSG